MIDLIDFNDCKETTRTYGGNAGRKIAISFDGMPWIIKYPGNLKNFPDIAIDYSTSPLAEYLASHIYELLNIPVHQTILGIIDDKIVVACKDFCENDKLLAEFKTFKVTYKINNNKATDGDGTILTDILEVLQENKILLNTEGIKTRFWDMFVVDAFLGNPDRNNGNWGLLQNFNREILGLAPVYDNGNSLNSKWDNPRMKNFLKGAFKHNKILNSSTSVYYDNEGKHIKPFIFLNQTSDLNCINSVISIYEKIKIDDINNLINELYKSKIISELQSDFYHTILTKRYEIALNENYYHALEIRNNQNQRINI